MRGGRELDVNPSEPGGWRVMVRVSSGQTCG